MTLQEEKELLLRVVTRLAAKLIGQGGFVPFGATLGPGRNVKLLMPKGWKENATRDELEAYWSRELKKATTEPDCKTVCSCADVRVPMDNGDLAPGILIHLEQIGSPAEDICLPVPQTRHGSETWHSNQRRDRAPRVCCKPDIET